MCVCVCVSRKFIEVSSPKVAGIFIKNTLPPRARMSPEVSEGTHRVPMFCLYRLVLLSFGKARDAFEIEKRGRSIKIP